MALLDDVERMVAMMMVVVMPMMPPVKAMNLDHLGFRRRNGH
jgi:hypothetical protein